MVEHNSSMLQSEAILKCSPGWNGGLKQTFTLEVRVSSQVHARVLAAHQHSPAANFHIRNLKPDEEYLFTITAANSRGTSIPVTITYTTPPSQAGNTNAHTDSNTTLLNLTPFLAILMGVVVTLLLCLIIGVIIAKQRGVKNKHNTKILYAGPIRDQKESFSHSGPTIVCINKGKSLYFINFAVFF